MNSVRVLVVDDERIARDGLRRLLSADNEVEIVVSGAQHGGDQTAFAVTEQTDLLGIDLLTGEQVVDRGLGITREI